MKTKPMTKIKRLSREANVLLLVALFASYMHVAAAPTPQAAGAQASPAGVVRAFYQHHFAHEQCCFNEEGLKARRAWFTPALYERMLREVRKVLPEDEVPYFNGDPFTNSQEGPVDFRLGRARVRGGRATVSVTLRFTDGRRTIERRTLNLELLRQRGDWKIDNIRYPDGTDFVSQLKEADRESRR